MLENDRNIHISLAEITGNQLFVWLTTTLIGHFNLYVNSWRSEDFLTGERNYESLSRIVNAIKNLDSKKASLEAREHVLFGKEHVYKLSTDVTVL